MEFKKHEKALMAGITIIAAPIYFAGMTAITVSEQVLKGYRAAKKLIKPTNKLEH